MINPRLAFSLLAAGWVLGAVASTTTLTVSSNPSIYGQPVLLTATVSPTTATGIVTFYNGATILGDAPVVSGTAVLNTIALPGGPNLLRAFYSGDAVDLTATSASVPQNVKTNPGGSFASSSPGPLATGIDPGFVGVADFNGDGKPDLVFSNGTNGIVLLGNGSGGFTPAPGSPFPGPPAAVADFNSDGKPDLAVIGSSGLTILLGDGSGGFTPASGGPFVVGTNPGLPAVGDFNGDGKADLAVPALGTVWVLLGNGAGGFTAAPPIPYPISRPSSVAVGDFNRDGQSDLAVTFPNGVMILLGNGIGGFTLSAVLAAGTTPMAAVVADFNGDGKPDLAIANAGVGAGFGSSGDVTVLLGNGAGGFVSAIGSPFAAGANPSSIVVADFNGDGKADLALPNFSSNNLTILLGDGSGSFTQPPGSPFAIGTGPIAITSADFNGDGTPDLVIANRGDKNLRILLGSGVPVSSPQWSIAITDAAVFRNNQNASYTISVTNSGAASTSGTVTVNENPSSGLTFLSMSGAGWSCAGSTCFRTDPLNAGASYPPLEVTVELTAAASSTVINRATVSGGGATPASASDVTALAPPPFGLIDTPADNATGITGAIGVTGWALSLAGISNLALWREPVPGETQSGLVFIGNATLVPGARPDVALRYPGYPGNDTGWGAQILTNLLPNTNGSPGLGNGTYAIHAISTDLGGQSVELGVRVISTDNAHATLPFGTIDTPAQGGMVSGAAYINFGWALTPNPDNVIPKNGSTIFVFIDNQPVGHPVYNNFRSDIAALFPGLQNSNGGVGYFVIDTTKLANGMHTIAWSVTDSASNAQGIGSRLFNVQN